MQQDHFFAFAVGAGFLLIGLVFYSYLRPKPEHRPAVTALLGLLGFALVASPNWTRISIRSDGLELSLLREIEGRQLRALGELRASLRERDGPASDARAGPAPPAPVRPRHTDEEAGASPNEAPAAEDDAAERPQRSTAERLLAAYRRGQLDLGALSDGELLALNAHLTERGARAARDAAP